MRYLSIFFVGLLFSCVDLYNPGLTNEKLRLTVEARITTELDFQWVFLTYDAAYSPEPKEHNFAKLVLKAQIWIVDDQGNRFDFVDDNRKAANYKTPSGYDYRSRDRFQAVVGRSYQLFVNTEDGKKYRSKWQLVKPVPKLSKPYSAFEKITTIPRSIVGQFLLYTDVADSNTPDEYYQWESIHWERVNFCRIFALPDFTPPTIFGNPCCINCYEYTICKECNPIANDKLTNGKPFRQLIAKIPYSSTDSYYINIRQYSITKDIYTFWETLKQQSQNTGGIFDVTPQTVRGNMECISDPTEEVLGVFMASDVAELTYYFDRNLADPKPYIPFKPETTGPCFACQEINNRTAIAPKGWDFTKR